MWLLPLVLGFCDDEIAIGHPPDSYLGEILYSGELTTVGATTRARLLPAFPRQRFVQASCASRGRSCIQSASVTPAG